MMSVHVKTTFSFAPAPRDRSSPCIRNQGIHKAIQLDDKTFGQFSTYVDQDLGRALQRNCVSYMLLGEKESNPSRFCRTSFSLDLTSTTGHGNGSIPDVTPSATFLCLPVNLGKLLRVKLGGEERAISGATHENNMTDHTTDEAPGCGATHFALFGNLNFREHDPALTFRHR